MKRFFVFIALILGQLLVGQTPKELYLQSIKAHRYKDYPRFLDLVKTLDSIRPNNPTYVYNLARAYALNGQPKKAVSVLRQRLLADSATDYETEPDFDSLRELPEYQKLSVLKESLGKLVANSRRETTLKQKDLHPEGLVYLDKSKLWLAASVRKASVVSFDLKTGKCTEWLKTDLPVFAIKPDRDQKYLWVATSATPEMEGYSQSLENQAEILKVNIRTKTIEQRFGLDGKHLYGDLIVADDGSVYVSDSLDPSIYLIKNGGMIQWLALSGRTFSLQGLTFNADQSKIYVADYLNGILEVPIGDRNKKRWLEFPEQCAASGIDGLAWHDNSLIAIHNGVKPIRIIRYFLDAAGNITSAKVIDNNRPEFKEPTLGFVNRGKFYFFANSPWSFYDRAKKNLELDKFENPMLYSFKLD